MKKIKKYISVIMPLIYMILLLIASTIGLVIINLIINAITGVFTGENNYKSDILLDTPHLPSLLISFIVALVFLAWYRRLKKNEGLVKKRRLALKDKGFFIVWGVGVVFFVNGVVDLLFIVLEIYFPQLVSDYINMMSSMEEGSLIIIAIRVAIIAPLLEELVFRGVILKKARDIMPFYAANIVQAILFGLIHLNVIQCLYVFPVGILFGYIARRYRSIIPSIVLHALLNGYAVLHIANSRLAEESIDFSRWFFVVTTIVGGVIFIIGLNKIRRSSYIEDNIVIE
ncbi:MAG: type II CAAX endopeptidase family protein [Bacilli bacterium]|nr:type II CAAX endopeptidase family protein [Bacilli bacterium]